MGNYLLSQKNVLITGASGGIGRAISLKMAHAGANLFLHGFKNTSVLDTLTEEVALIQHHLGIGSSVTGMSADLSDPRQQEILASRAWMWRPDGIQILVQCAGVDILKEPIRSLSYEDKLRLLWNVDVTATIRLARDLGARMKLAHPQQGMKNHGVIINIGWDGINLGINSESGELFGAAKGAITAFSRSFAQRMAPLVRVNCLAPGWIKTLWGENAPVPWQQRVCEDSLLHRWGMPEDVAAAALFLASDDADFLNDLILPINGGIKR